MDDKRVRELIEWLQIKWRRHREIEDKEAADALESLQARLAEAAKELEAMRKDAAELAVMKGRKVRYVRTRSPITKEQITTARESSLFPIGDMILVWCNEGDLCWLGEDAALGEIQT